RSPRLPQTSARRPDLIHNRAYCLSGVADGLSGQSGMDQAKPTSKSPTGMKSVLFSVTFPALLPIPDVRFADKWVFRLFVPIRNEPRETVYRYTLRGRGHSVSRARVRPNPS